MLSAALLGEWSEGDSREVVLSREPEVYPLIFRYLGGVRRNRLASAA